MTSVFDMRLESEMEATVGTILIVEDDDAIREFLTHCIETETPHHALPLANQEEVFQHLDTLKETSIVLFIFDLSLLMLTAIDLYDRLCGLIEHEHVPAIILTTLRPEWTIESAIIKRGLKLLLKPFDVDDLLRSIEEALTRPTQLI